MIVISVDFSFKFSIQARKFGRGGTATSPGSRSVENIDISLVSAELVKVRLRLKDGVKLSAEQTSVIKNFVQEALVTSSVLAAIGAVQPTDDHAKPAGLFVRQSLSDGKSITLMVNLPSGSRLDVDAARATELILEKLDKFFDANPALAYNGSLIVEFKIPSWARSSLVLLCDALGYEVASAVVVHDQRGVKSTPIRASHSSFLGDATNTRK